MKRKSRIQVVIRRCPRCGKNVVGTNRSIHGAEQGFEKFAGVCSACITTEEHREILEAQGSAIVGRKVNLR